MSKKRLNTIGVLNELSGQSVFFQRPTQTERKTVRKSDRSEKRTVMLPVRRSTKRYSFEFYEDQIARLRKIKTEAGLRGENIFLSEIVRQALDAYFHQQETERTENRSEIRPFGEANGKSPA